MIGTDTNPEHARPLLDDDIWWLSFCDPDLPKGSQFLGVLILPAQSLFDAISESHRRGLNPGGQVQAVGPLPLDSIGTAWWWRLLDREQAESVPEPGNEVQP